MSELNKLSLKEAISGIKEKKFSPKELFSDTIFRIKEVEGKLSSFITVNEGVEPAFVPPTAGLRRGEGRQDKHPLYGIPMAVKDVLSTKGIRTTASSKILEDYVPVYDATVVSRLKEAGAIIIGKTNCDAFAFGASTENSGYGSTKNPWDQNRVPGGSSGGSAAAVAADECIFSLGTDTGGSIRQPASFCSVTGLKPTYGSCSRFGLLAMASSFDCPGPIGKSVEDCEIVFNLMKGRDEKDGTSVDLGKVGEKGKKRKGGKTTIGIPKEFFTDAVDPEVRKSVLDSADLLSNNGYEIIDVSLPNTEYAIAVYYILVPSEISSNMARYTEVRFGKDRSFFEDEVERRIMIGTYALSTGYFDQYYNKASKARALIQKDYLNVFEKADLILSPVSPTTAFKLNEKTQDPLQMYLADILTVSANLAGIPGLALPCGFSSSGLPIGMQILGPHFSEDILFETGKKYQQITNWHLKKPNI